MTQIFFSVLARLPKWPKNRNPLGVGIYYSEFAINWEQLSECVGRNVFPTTTKINEIKLIWRKLGSFTNYVYKTRFVSGPKMSTFCQHLYHRKFERRGVGDQKKVKSCQRSLWMTSCFQVILDDDGERDWWLFCLSILLSRTRTKRIREYSFQDRYLELRNLSNLNLIPSIYKYLTQCNVIVTDIFDNSY